MTTFEGRQISHYRSSARPDLAAWASCDIKPANIFVTATIRWSPDGTSKDGKRLAVVRNEKGFDVVPMKNFD